MARLGPVDLETLDALITAGIATNRADAVRWALAHIRERPAYGQLRERASERARSSDSKPSSNGAWPQPDEPCGGCRASLMQLPRGVCFGDGKAVPRHIGTSGPARQTNTRIRLASIHRRELVDPLLWSSGPVNGKPIQRIAKRIHSRLNEVISDSLC